MQNLKEKLLIFRVSEGKDQRAYAELYRIYYDKIRSFVFFKVSSKEEAEDLASQAFLKAWEYMTNLEQRRVQDFKGFIYQLTRNLVVDFYRRQGRAPDVIALEDQGEEENIPDSRQDFFLTQLYKSDRAYITDCLKRLHDGYREIVVLRFLEDMEIGEIAEITGKTPGNVRVLIHRGIKALKKIVENEYDHRERTYPTAENAS